MFKKRFLSKFHSGNSNVIITDLAWKKISTILNKTKEFSFFFSAKGGGCNGFNYDFRTINKSEFNKIKNNSNKLKITILEKNNYKILIDPLAEFLLLNTTIDYYEDLYENKFIFKRDKSTVTSCGCGTSFSMK